MAEMDNPECRDEMGQVERLVVRGNLVSREFRERPVAKGLTVVPALQDETVLREQLAHPAKRDPKANRAEMVRPGRQVTPDQRAVMELMEALGIPLSGLPRSLQRRISSVRRVE